MHKSCFTRRLVWIAAFVVSHISSVVTAADPLPDCATAATNATVCFDLYRIEGSECGYSGNQNQCVHCMGTGVSQGCSPNPPAVSPCIYNPGTDSCVSSGFDCGQLSTFGADVCNHSMHFVKHCAYDTASSTCKDCSQFSTADCPAPSCLSNGGSCQSATDVCGALTTKSSCVQDGASLGCYFEERSMTRCVYCGQITQSDMCDNSPACHWNSAVRFCIAGARANGSRAEVLNTTPIILAVVIPAIAALACAILLIAYKDRICRKRAVHHADDELEVTSPGAWPATLHSDKGHSDLDYTTAGASSSVKSSIHVSQLHLTMPSITTSNTPSNVSEMALRAPALFQDGKVQRLKLLGRGANGSVYSCVLPDGYLVAMKEVLLPSCKGKEDNDAIVETIMKEVSIISSLDHSNIVRCFGSALETQEQRLTIFMELVPNGSLASMVQGMPEPMQEGVARLFVRQLVSALAYIHERGVVHRDIKCDNVLITAEGRLKLTDFGASRIVGTGTMATRGAQTMVGTPHFMAPEILVGGDDGDGTDSGYGRRADIWSLGITVVEMMECGKAPWPAFPSTGAAFMHIATPGSLPIIPARFSDEARDFVLQCCRRDPLERPTSQALQQHPWLTSNFDVVLVPSS